MICSMSVHLCRDVLQYMHIYMAKILEVDPRSEKTIMFL